MAILGLPTFAGGLCSVDHGLERGPAAPKDEPTRAFVAAAGETSAMRRFVEYNVRRARRNGLLPPTFATLKAEHPDVYWLLPKEVTAAEAEKRGSR